jgi:hypothetical protein
MRDLNEEWKCLKKNNQIKITAHAFWVNRTHVHNEVGNSTLGILDYFSKTLKVPTIFVTKIKIWKNL